MPKRDAEARREYQRAYYRDYYKRNRDTILSKNRLRDLADPVGSLERSRRYRQRHQEKCRQAGRDAYHNPVEKAKQRARTLQRKFGISVELYEEMYMAQRGLCAICGEPERRTHTRSPDPIRHGPLRLAVDHDHTTGAVRALLCRDCNRGLGGFGDDTDRLRAAANYLEVAKRKTQVSPPPGDEGSEGVKP